MTASATLYSSPGLFFCPPLMAALQAMVWSRASRAASGSAEPPVSSFPASSPSTSGISPAATSLGAARTISVPPPKSSVSKPNRSSRGSWASRAAPSSAGGVNTTGSSRACTMGW